MGSTIESQNKITAFLGAKGGVGCSVISSLLARIIAKKIRKKLAILDGTPSSYSLLPSYLSVKPSGRYLTQLLPYQDRLTSKMVETFFPISPEGVAYIPIKQ